MAAATELSALISKTVEEQTFSLDAVKAIGAIRDRAIALEEKLSERETMIAQRDETISQQRKELAETEKKSNALRELEISIIKREANITALEKQVAVSLAESKILDSVVTRVFANRMVREDTITSTPIMNNGINGSPGFVSNYDTRNTIARTEG